MMHKLLNNDKALKLCKSAKNFKEIAETTEFENFFIIDDKIFCEFSSTSFLKMLATICTKKTFFYAIQIETKLEMIISQDIKEFTSVSSQLILLKFSCLML